MLHVAIGHSEGIHTDAVIRQVLGQCAAQLGAVRPRVGLLFVSGDFDQQRILDAIAERFPGTGLIGCTTRGDMSSLAGFSEDSINLVLLASDTLALSVGLGRECSKDPEAAIRQALAQARAGLGVPERLCIILPDITRKEGGDLVLSLGRQLAPGCGLFGGAAARPWVLEVMPIGQFFGRELTGDALPMLLVGGPVEYSFSIENEWRPLGERQRVTNASGLVVSRIGDKTALGFHHHYLGRHSRPLAEFPLAVFEEGETDHFYLRVGDSYDTETGQVRYVDKVPDGAMVQLTEAVRPHMLEQTESCLAHLGAELREKQPLLALSFSCGARRRVLGTQVAREAETVRKHLHDTPLVGFYGFGEIAPTAPGRSSFLHQATLVTLVLHAAEEDTRQPAWHPPATQTFSADDPQSPQLLARRLARSQYFSDQLEQRQEQSSTLLRTVNDEIARSRELIAEQNEALRQLHEDLAREKKKTDELLRNVLPEDVAEELKRTGKVMPVHHESVTVLFTDFEGFTRIASAMTPNELLDQLDFYFSAFDTIIGRHGLEKLKTIGDSYMAAGGLPAALEDNALAVVRAGWEMQEFMRQANRPPWKLRMGINTGPLMAGVIGRRKFAYDIWGDTVNIASRLESNGEAGRINISQSTYEHIRNHFECEYRGKIPVKNAGGIDMYFVTRPKPAKG